MPDNFVLNKFKNEMHKRGEDSIDSNNPMYPTFDSFNLMKHSLLGHIQKEIKTAQSRLNDLEEEFLSVMDIEEGDITVFTRDGK